MAVHQVIPWAHWPSGDSRPIVVLPFEVKELASRYGLKFQEAIDDLGPYRLAAIELTKGAQAWISKHDSDPNPGTVVYVDAGADIEKAQLRLIKALGITRHALLWAAPPDASIRAAASVD
jgi:hypothetical protein